MIEATYSGEGGSVRFGSGSGSSRDRGSGSGSHRNRSGSGTVRDRPGDISYIPASSFVGGVSSSTLPRSGHCQKHPYNVSVTTSL